MKLVFIHIILLLLVIPFWLNGQHHFFRQYSLEEGLPQSEVNDIAEDQFGYLWIGTNGGGLCRFNGKDFEVFTKKDGLQEDLIMGLYSDINYDLWIGSPKGISKYDGAQFKHFIQSDTALFQDRMQFLETIDGSVWAVVREVTGKRAIYQFNGDSIINFTRKYQEELDGKRIFFVTKLGAKKLLLSTNEGIYEIEGGVLKSSSIKKDYAIEDRVLVPLLQGKYRNIWSLSFSMQNMESELVQLSFDGTVKKVNWPEEFPLDRVFRVHEDRDGGVWIAVASGGIVWFKNGEFKIFNKANGLNTSLVTSFGEDREGNMWFGTSGSGLFKYGGDKFISFNKESGLGGDIVRAIFQDSKGNIYMGDDNNTISMYDGHRVNMLKSSSDIQMGQARKMVELENGHLLIGTLSGLFLYDHKQFKNISTYYGLRDAAPVVDMIKNEDTLWIAVYGVGLLKYHNGKKEWIKPANSGLKSTFITNLFIDSQHNLWVSTTKGVYKYDHEKFTHYNDRDQLNSAWVLQTAEDKAGNIWFATFTGGLNRFDGEHFTYFDKTKGVKSDNIYSVIADVEGNIWAGTQNGVDKLTIENSGEVVSIQNFDKDDGFIGIENNGGCNLLDKEGRLWFGTIKGAMMYNPEAEKINYLEPPVHIRKILLDFKKPDWESDTLGFEYDSLSTWFELPQNLNLSSKNNHIAFVFDALCYTVPEKTKYKWKLEPIEQEWSPENDFNMAFYPSLQPGNYTFRVIACNNDGVWNEEGDNYSFEIKPAWYQYLIIKILGVLILLGVLMWVIRLRINKEKDIKRELESRLAQKKLEIQKQQAEINNKANILEEQKEMLERQADSLSSANQDIERLTRIGQLVTSNLSLDRIAELLYSAVSKVMSSDVFSVGLFNPEEKSIDFTHAYLKGERQPFTRYLIEDKERLAVYAFTHERDVFINNFYEEYKNFISEVRPVPTGAETESVIYVPLRTAHEIIGVVSVQSLKKNAYTDYHFNFIKNIANYASIAFDNANKFQNLVDEQKALIDKHEGVLGEKDLLDKQKQLLEEMNLDKNQLFNLFVKGIQQPLNHAIGRMQTFMQESDNCTSEQKCFLNEMLSSLRQQNEIVNKVLEVRNIENEFYSYTPEPFELIAVIKEVANGLEMYSKDKNINVIISGKETEVNLDMNLLVKILENLMSNAIRFSPEGQEVRVIAIKDQERIKIEVHDKGPGLTEEEKEKVFEKYSKLQNMNDDLPTSGLGLYIVKKYVDVMNGRISCESVSGFGASFIVEFPIES